MSTQLCDYFNVIKFYDYNKNLYFVDIGAYDGFIRFIQCSKKH